MGFCFVECRYSWIVLIHRIHSFCGWDAWPGFFLFFEMILFYGLAGFYGFMDSHGIYGHGLISWIHSIHDLGSFSFGSGIFLFRIYVLLMSWHTSRILFLLPRIHSMGFFYPWNHWISWAWMCSWAYVYASYY